MYKQRREDKSDIRYLASNRCHLFDSWSRYNWVVFARWRIRLSSTPHVGQLQKTVSFLDWNCNNVSNWVDDVLNKLQLILENKIIWPPLTTAASHGNSFETLMGRCWKIMRGSSDQEKCGIIKYGLNDILMWQLTESDHADHSVPG